MSEERAGYRSYEIHQRERPGEATPLIRPGELRSVEYLQDPYRMLGILREHYPCYRDWSGNAYWITRYDDVTSVFQDDANYETRSKRSWYGIPDLGRDLGASLPVLTAHADGVDEHAPRLAEEVIGRMTERGDADLSTDLALPFSNELLARVLDLPADDVSWFAARNVAMQRGFHADPVAEQAGREAIAELVEYFRPLVEARRVDPGPDLVSAICGADADGTPGSAEDVVATLLEADHETLPGALANLWFLLLTHPEQFEEVVAERRLVKPAYLEALRHSTPVLSAPRFAATRGRAVRAPLAHRRADHVLGGGRQPRSEGVRRPGGVPRAAQGSVPAGAARAVPRRRVVLRDRLRARQAVHPPGCA